MDNDEYLKRLNEVAKFALPKPQPLTRGQKSTIRKKIEKIKQQDLWEEDTELVEAIAILEAELDDRKPNWTQPIEFLEFRNNLRDCEDCGKKSIERKISSRLCTTPRPHWRTICSNCKQWRNPETGKFDINGRSVQPFFNQYLLEKNK